MVKLFLICASLFPMLGCQSIPKYTTHQEYVEEQKWDREKGLNKHSKASWAIRWEN